MENIASNQVATLTQIAFRDPRLSTLLENTITDRQAFEAEQSEALIQDQRHQFTKSINFHGYKIFTHYQNQEEGQTYELNSGRIIKLGLACIQRTEAILSNGRNWDLNNMSAEERIIVDCFKGVTQVSKCMQIVFESMLEQIPTTLSLTSEDSSLIKRWGKEIVESTQPVEV